MKEYRVSLNLTAPQLELLRTLTSNAISANHDVGSNPTRDERHIALEVANALLDLRQRVQDEQAGIVQ